VWGYTSTPPMRLHSVVLSESTGKALALSVQRYENQNYMFSHYLYILDR